MTHDPERDHRRSVRLSAYDYAQPGAYFITIVAHARACLFGDVANGIVQLSQVGQVIADEWMRTGVIRRRVKLDTFVVMPNHVHGIIVLGVGSLPRPLERFARPTADSIPTIVRLFKSVTTKRVNESRATPGAPVWQRSYHEHVIRDEASLHRIRRYVTENPARWASDSENPELDA